MTTREHKITIPLAHIPAIAKLLEAVDEVIESVNPLSLARLIQARQACSGDTLSIPEVAQKVTHALPAEDTLPGESISPPLFWEPLFCSPHSP